MASGTLASDAALQAEDKQLLIRNWVDSNSRKSKHPRPVPSWDPQITCIKCKDAGVKVCVKPLPSHDTLATVASQADGISRSWDIDSAMGQNRFAAGVLVEVGTKAAHTRCPQRRRKMGRSTRSKRCERRTNGWSRS